MLAWVQKNKDALSGELPASESQAKQKLKEHKVGTKTELFDAFYNYTNMNNSVYMGLVIHNLLLCNNCMSNLYI